MNRRNLWIALLLVLAAAFPLRAEFFCQRYEFALDKFIRLGGKVGDIEILDAKFEFPTYVGPKSLGIKGRHQVALNLKNYGTKRMKVAIGVSLFDADGNLVGTGTTGTKIAGTKSGGTESFYVSFDYLNGRIATAKTFYLAVETEPEETEASHGTKAAKSAG